MHREYRPQEMHQLDADPFAPGAAGHGDHESRALYVFTALLGLLIGGDVLLSFVGLGEWRLPGGISLSLVAALLGAVYIVYGALDALFHGRLGADFALAQACIAALVLGQPFVAAEVVFIALVGEVLEAVTFARTKRAVRSLVDQTPRTARVRRDGVEVEISARDVAVGELVIVRPGERIPVDGPVLAGRLDGRSIGAHRRVDPGGQGALRPGLHGHAQPVRCDRGSRRQGRPRHHVWPGCPAGRRRPGAARRSSSGWPIGWPVTSCRPSRSPPRSRWPRATCWAGPMSGPAPWLSWLSPVRVPWSWPLRRPCWRAWPGSLATGS